MDCGRQRFNDELIGTLSTAKRLGTDCLDGNYNKQVRTERTIERPVTFPSHAEWLRDLRENSKLLENAQRERKELQETMDENLEYHYNWLQAKFKPY